MAAVVNSSMRHLLPLQTVVVHEDRPLHLVTTTAVTIIIIPRPIPNPMMKTGKSSPQTISPTLLNLHLRRNKCPLPIFSQEPHLGFPTHHFPRPQRTKVQVALQQWEDPTLVQVVLEKVPKLFRCRNLQSSTVCMFN